MADETTTETALEAAITTSRNLRPRTREIYLKAVQLFLERCGPEPSRWTRDAVMRWRRDLHVRLSAQTVNLHLRGLQAAAGRWAEKTGEKDFTADIAPLDVEPSEKNARPLSIDQVQRILATTNGDRPIDLRDRALLITGFRTGLRRTAVRTLTFERVQGNLLTVDTKGGNVLTLAIDPEVTRHLRVWMTWLKKHGHSEGPIFRGLARPHVDGSVSVRDNAIGPDNVTWIVRSRAQAAGLKTEIHRDVFRYTFKAWCEKHGIADDRVREVTSLKLDGADVEVGRAIGNDLPELLGT